MGKNKFQPMNFFVPCFQTSPYSSMHNVKFEKSSTFFDKDVVERNSEIGRSSIFHSCSRPFSMRCFCQVWFAVLCAQPCNPEWSGRWASMGSLLGAAGPGCDDDLKMRWREEPTSQRREKGDIAAVTTC